MEISEICILDIRICMNWQNLTFDWNQIRAFLVTAEEGSLSAAAKALGLTQPTLSRQVSALEAALGVTLFERVGRKLVLTETGITLLDHVREMGAAANRFALCASGRSQAVEGRVTITATDMVSSYVLPAILADLARSAPGIDVTIVAANDIRDLQRGEADIALRNAAPTEPNLIARALRPARAFCCAAQPYIDTHGPLNTMEDLKGATWVGYGAPEQMVAALQTFGLELRPEQVKYTCEMGVVVWELAKQGLGVTIMADEAHLDTLGLARVAHDFPDIQIPLYLISHSELRNSRRISVVWDALVAALG